MTYKKLASVLLKKLEKDYGVGCKNFELNCIVCQVYLAHSIILDLMLLNEPKKK